MWSAFYLTGVLASLVASVFFSIHARRQGIHPLASRMTLGKMNVALGVLVTLFGVNQFTFEQLDTIRLVVAFIMLLVGVMNLFLGTRNYFRYRTAWQAELKKGT